MEIDLSFSRDEHKLAQSLVAYRIAYLSADEGEKATARTLVNQLAELAKTGSSLKALPNPQLNFRVVRPMVTPTIEGDVEIAEVPVGLLARAIAVWDKGDHFVLDYEDFLSWM